MKTPYSCSIQQLEIRNSEFPMLRLRYFLLSGISHCHLAKNRTLPAREKRGRGATARMEMAETCFGVHLGCTSACIAYCKVVMFYSMKRTPYYALTPFRMSIAKFTLLLIPDWPEIRF